jgi:UPF0755 protein
MTLMNRRRSSFPFLFLIALFFILAATGFILETPVLVERSFGSASPRLGDGQKLRYALDLLWNSGNLLEPVNRSGPEQIFTIEQGESATSISKRLEEVGLIQDASSLRAYLTWTGIDTSLQPGVYRLAPSMTAVEIAQKIQSAVLSEVSFYILPGWRAEEIAAALPSSGLSISPQDFLVAVSHPAAPPYFLNAGTPGEGFLLPDRYQLSRAISADQLVAAFLADFDSALTPGLRNGFANHGLTIHQAVILASIVQRETVGDEEMPVIASVFYNRLAAGMKLETDPTVQYALGFNAAQNTWWTNPLSMDDLKVDSPYNTYLYPGLPPAPISNPGLTALEAVADPAQTDYYYFQARCDNSGRHNFAATFEQHLQNACP